MTTENVQFDPQELKDILKAAKSRCTSDWEKKFVKSQIERFKKWGADLHISQKQLDMLKVIAKREVFDDDEL